VSVGVIIAIVVILVVIAAVAAWMAMRRSSERRNLGPEYSRLVDEMGARRANAEYDKRRRRVDGLGIKPLSDERRTLYASQWVVAQETFIDNPAEAVRTAGALVTAVAADRGYEVADSQQLLTDLSVNYGSHLDGYRNALTLTNRAAANTATEQLRQALLDYRAMFDALGEFPRDKDEVTATPATAATTGAGVAPVTPAATTAGAVEPPTAVTPALDPTTTAVPAQLATDDAAADQAAADPVATDPVATDQAADGTGHRVFWRREHHETGTPRS
jgi:hypothetical protein